MPDLMELDRYAFVLAHPDDEVYTAATIRQLCGAGKTVSLTYLTNGDAKSPEMGITRQRELWASMELLGVDRTMVNLLGYPEHLLLDEADDVMSDVIECTGWFEPELIIGHDWEGGHNMHDFASLCGAVATEYMNLDVNAHTGFAVFPAYHGPPEQRRWNRFIAGREANYRIPLTREEGMLKRAVIETHASQEPFFAKLLASPDARSFLGLEELRDGSDIDFHTKPTDPVGYEAPGSTARFDTLQEIANRWA